jgi:prepilin-type N-terminal cleavage/methylation domain-containing protein/prepilin-type processing-associated H-X9-DG protein
MRQTSATSNNAFTLIECLVVILVTGILIALLLPALQSSRETARRALCQNHLKQVGGALAGYHAARGRYPAGIRPTERSDGILFAAPLQFSAYGDLLPYLDQTVVYNAINFSNQFVNGRVSYANALARENLTVLQTTLEVLLCPSDASGPTPGCNYRCSVGSQPFEMPGPSWMGGDGAFPGLYAMSSSAFTDGLSSTIGASERVRGSGESGTFDRFRDLWFTSYSELAGGQAAPDNQETAEICASLTSAQPPCFRGSGHYWLGGTFQDTLYNHVLGPNSNVTDCSLNGGPGGGRPDVLTRISGGAISARSRHPGGVNVLVMDGSVRFIGDSIDLRVWRAASTRAGAEVNGAF